MPAPIQPATARTLLPRLQRSPWHLLRVDRAPQFHAGLADALDGLFPGQFGFTTLPRGELRPELDGVFQTALGALRRGVLDGYYLFDAGKVVGFHTGAVRSAHNAYASDHHDDPLRDRITGLLGRRSASELDAVHQLGAYFVPIVQRRLTAGPAPAWNDAPRESARSTPPPVAPRPPPGPDPYATLGVARDALDEEVKAAFKKAIKLNHPDKVAHLSPELQKFAEQQVLRIKAAWEEISRARGLA
jgi:hypothetical protein